MNTRQLEARARRLRLQVLETVVERKKGHLGGTYSAIELFVALYYGGLLRFDPKHPRWPGRDRFLIGKGHAALALYYIWHDLGMLSDQRLASYASDGGLGGQLDLSIPGAENNTGSLGHVVGIGCGMAMAARLDGADYRVVALLGDAECDEGSVWEGAMFASRQGLDKLVCIVDRNRLSVTQKIDYDDSSGPLERHFAAFGWQALTIDGHDFSAIAEAFERAGREGKPTAIIADTIKGKGVSFMEGVTKWHHSVPGHEQLAIARRELGGETP